MIELIAMRQKVALCALTLIMSGLSGQVLATDLKVLYEFKSNPDGKYPEAGLLSNSAGNLYGTTYFGGSYHDGTVFKLAPDGTETVLHVFAGDKNNDGQNPRAGLIADSSGNLFGTTFGGGVSPGQGTVFKLSPGGTETILHTFTGNDGAGPGAGALILDAAGNLYGTTVVGGTGNGGGGGAGVVFEIAADGTFSVLYNFQGGHDGEFPEASLIMDNSGNLYGTTSQGGSQNSYGTVFKLAPGGTETVLYRFKGTDGQDPWSGLIVGSDGNFYGMTGDGGSNGDGTIFKLAPDATETVLYSFRGGEFGDQPVGNLLMGVSGNLYGTTNLGGIRHCFEPFGCGTIFRLAPDGTFKILHAFDGQDGQLPYAGLIADQSGNLYGTTQKGGRGIGNIFSIKE
jgi:uncharacterized repeat protein (TIGR03803 family)